MGGGRGGYSEAHVFYLSMSLKVGHFSIYIPPPLPWGPLHSIYLCRKNLPPTPLNLGFYLCTYGFFKVMGLVCLQNQATMA